MTEYKLFIDESGSSYPQFNPKGTYILTGCVIDETKRAQLKASCDALKMKYWNDASVVLHSAEMGKNIGAFAIFANDSALKAAFLKDLLVFLNAAPVIAITAIVDKKHISPTWVERTLVEKTAKAVIRNFIFFLFTKKNPNGQVVIESAGSTKDIEYLKSFGYFIAPNCKMLEPHFTYLQVRQVLTSMSFVTKHNNDPEEQIADLLGYAAYCKFGVDQKKKVFSANSYEGKLVKVLERKLFHIPSTTGAKKLQYFQEIDSFHVMPVRSSTRPTVK